MTQFHKNQIIFYGTNWCPDCIRAKLVLKKLGAEFAYVDTDKDQEAERVVIQINHGKRIVPTIIFPDKSALVEPSNRELTEKVINLGLARTN